MNFQYVKIILIVFSLLFSGNVAADVLKSGGMDASIPDEKGFLMASTSEEGTACGAPVPVLFNAVPGDGHITISWRNEHTVNPDVTGYNIYSVRDGKSEPLTSVWPRDTHTVTGLKNGKEYCFKITSLHSACESGFSNSVCAVPEAQDPQK